MSRTNARRRRSALFGLLLATSVAASACGSPSVDPASSTPTTRSPQLTKTVSFGGVSIRVPAYFTVVSGQECGLSWNDSVDLGTGNGACSTNSTSRPGTGVVVSTEPAPLGATPWQRRSIVNGLNIESSTGRFVASQPCTVKTFCAPHSVLSTWIPSKHVALVFVSNSSLTLAMSMLRTVTATS